jgi:carbon monoxide dehydrogenase subunit G
MKLENEFTVPASIDQAWAVLLDVPRVAPCLPGATVEPDQGEEGEYKGQMKIKIGPITASYKGTVRIQETDEANHVVAMRAQAKDARGQGTAAATITSTMTEVPEGTKVSVVTDMRVTGPAAQFGRGVMQDVSAKLMTRFADCLAEQMQGEPEAEPAATEGGAGAGPAAVAGEGPSAATGDGDAAATGGATAEPAAAGEAPGASSGVSSAEATAPPSASSGTPTSSTTPPPKPRPTDDVLDLGEASRDAVLKRVAPMAAAAIALLILFRIIRK